MSANTNNWTYHSIAGAYFLGIIPHGIYFVKMMRATNWKTSNLTPRENLNTLRGKIPEDTFNKLCRLRGAHLNALESLPLFATAMIVGNMRDLPSKELNILAAEYLGVRLLYTAAYVGGRSEFLSYVRTGLFGWSVMIPIYVLAKAGNSLLGSGSV
ncbi:conserved hypothetical protein [Uncinocarpus reesii 1704]|uniref:Uncharacterized protein n=1 Tax=Uncinocarpus reesii (strain UAMH 1704) TaxID=336963 RepID=C4JJ60_UNCRE|nr:uncharacterized protein UREG_01667 [Uncinocarpus reesii 1704]EEP76818.1 conserved hypothetical protein [Uncinocarpus reesii 1704]